MQTDELITVREYLATSYRPDCDYVDGVVVARNLRERDHAKVLSPEDRLNAMARRVADFLEMGVPYVFILDPATRNAGRVTAIGVFPVSELRTENPEMVVPLEALFE